MSRRPSGSQQQQQRQPLINGATAWALENVLSPPPPPTQGQGNAGEAQRLATALGQDTQKILEAIPLLRDPRYQIISTTSSPDRRGVSVHVRPAATAAAASDSRQPPPKTEYTFFLTISEDGRQIVKVDMAVHSEH